MKGLLLKDLYMMKKYCRFYLLIAVVFIAVSFASNDNLFFAFYPCLLCGMIPVNLLSYDERSHWLQYSGTLPYTKEQIVSCKYLIGLMAQIAMLIVTGIAQALRMNMNGTFQPDNYILLILMVLIMTTIASSISLPFMFRLGVERGRIAYYVMIGVVCAGSVAASRLFRADLQTDNSMGGILPILCLIGIGIYALSWYVSIVFYKKREIS